MSNFNLEDYETVKERKQRFYKDFPDGRIFVELRSPVEKITEYALFMALVYRNFEDQKPISSGFAFELRDTEKKVSKYGKEYESVNYTSWTENAEESAIGRALDNAGYSGNNKCSREEMEKVERMQTVIGEKDVEQKTTAEKVEETFSEPAKIKGNFKSLMIHFKGANSELAFNNLKNIALNGEREWTEGELKIIKEITFKNRGDYNEN